MSFIDSLRNFIQETEADVQVVVGKIITGVELFETDLSNGLKWLAAHETVIIADAESVVSWGATIVGASNPTLTALANGTTVAIAALQTITADVNSGAGTAQTLVDGYAAVKTASAAISTAAAQVTKLTPAS